jgi:hypothetical protein
MNLTKPAQAMELRRLSWCWADADMATTTIANRYSAKLLFEFHIVVDGKPMVRRTCEERIIIVRALSADAALREAKRKGRASEFRFRNTHGDPGHFRLVGVMDLLELGVECEPEEVWYDITERVRPSERRASIIPREKDLNAFRVEALRRRGVQNRADLKALPNKQVQLTRSANVKRRGPRS